MNRDRIIAAIAKAKAAVAKAKAAVAKANVRVNGGGIAQSIGFGAVFGAVLGTVFSLRLGGFSGGFIASVAGGCAIMGGISAVYSTWLLRDLASASVKGNSRGDIHASKLAAALVAVLIVAGTAGMTLVVGVFTGAELFFNVVIAGSFFVGGVLAMLNARF